MIQKDLLILQEALDQLKEGFDSFPDTLTDSNETAIRKTMQVVAKKLQNNYPYFQPNYVGQMLKPPHAVARIAYMLALYINPNNHALDGSRASSPMEKECVSGIAQMFGWSESLGHLTSGGTMANLEALWVAGQIHPDKMIVASEFAHYTHERISGVLGLLFQKVKADQSGRMDMISLRDKLKSGDVGTVVVTLGTTGTGALDPLTEIIELQLEFKFRIHIDAAYGGYFKLADNLSAYAAAQFAKTHLVDSIVIDPHKHGLQPYGCGCILFKDLNVGQFYKHDSPYTYFSSAELHLGEITLACSRAGAAAVALWATMDVYPLTNGGAFANSLNDCHAAALKLVDLIKSEDKFIPIHTPELDIVVWAVRAESTSEMSKCSRAIFNLAAKQNLHLALIDYPVNLITQKLNTIKQDTDVVTCLRVCLMKPEHLNFIDEFWMQLNAVAEEVMK